MEISPIKMAMLLFYSFFFGTGVGMLYDANRIIRVFLGERYAKQSFSKIYNLKLPIVKKSIALEQQGRASEGIKNAVVFVGDFLCVTVFAIGIIILGYSYNNGIFRLFTLLGAAIGFLLYYHSVGKLVMIASEPIAVLIKYLFLSIFIIFMRPFLGIIHFFAKIIKKIVFLYSFPLENKAKKLYNIRRKVYLLDLAKNGFLTDREKDTENQL